MAGIYVHIPFCKQICHYCDFYKIASSKNIESYLSALFKEIELKHTFSHEKIQTIYFGGGTPSVLSNNQLDRIINQLSKNFDLSGLIESTIEVNPDDLNIDFLKEIRLSGFNRISIGVQSFNDEILKFLNRRHNAKNAIESIDSAFNAGFDNISVDLIYGIPGQSIDLFKKDLNTITGLPIHHLSAYHLGIEEKTYFGKLKKLGKFLEISENDSESYFFNLVNWSDDTGFEHYEISNFALNDRYSLHNSNYWSFVPYIGLGPSASSYYNNTRSFNVSNLNHYIHLIDTNKPFYELDILSELDKKNEYIMLKLRTKSGLNMLEIKKLCEPDEIELLMRRLKGYIYSEHIRNINDNFFLTKKGVFISDYIIRELMF
jgi:oxygen-independent coproporphyrinogen-3 oxidase